MDAGLSTTSPAAILLDRLSGRTIIFAAKINHLLKKNEFSGVTACLTWIASVFSPPAAIETPLHSSIIKDRSHLTKQLRSNIIQYTTEINPEQSLPCISSGMSYYRQRL